LENLKNPQPVVGKSAEKLSWIAPMPVGVAPKDTRTLALDVAPPPQAQLTYTAPANAPQEIVDFFASIEEEQRMLDWQPALAAQIQRTVVEAPHAYQPMSHQAVTLYQPPPQTTNPFLQGKDLAGLSFHPLQSNALVLRQQPSPLPSPASVDVTSAAFDPYAAFSDPQLLASASILQPKAQPQVTQTFYTPHSSRNPFSTAPSPPQGDQSSLDAFNESFGGWPPVQHP
jgi:hypothetical protein